jgi:hypothetical protein
MLFRKDSAAGLKKAQTALAAVERKINELEAARQLALAESDDVAAVHAVDLELIGQRQIAQTLADRIRILRAAIREQERDRLEAQRQAALVEVQKRLDAQVELAKEVEAAVRQLGDKWNELLRWRTAILSAWPEGLARPLASDFENVGPLRRELGTALYAAGNPAWDRLCAIPPPVAPLAVEGLSPKGISGYVAAAGAGFLARIRAQRIDSGVDDENTTEAADAA